MHQKTPAPNLGLSPAAASALDRVPGKLDPGLDRGPHVPYAESRRPAFRPH